MRAPTTTVQRLREAARRATRTTRSASTPADRAQLAAASACVTKRSRKEGTPPAAASPRFSRQVLEAERTRLLTRLEENARVLRGLHGTRHAYRLDLANVDRLLAALPTAA